MAEKLFLVLPERQFGLLAALVQRRGSELGPLLIVGDHGEGRGLGILAVECLNDYTPGAKLAVRCDVCVIDSVKVHGYYPLLRGSEIATPDEIVSECLSGVNGC